MPCNAVDFSNPPPPPSRRPLWPGPPAAPPSGWCRFHDGEKVRAADCVASLKRWSQRNPFGQKLASVTDELVALDDRRLRFRLKQRFPLLRLEELRESWFDAPDLATRQAICADIRRVVMDEVAFVPWGWRCSGAFIGRRKQESKQALLF